MFYIENKFAVPYSLYVQKPVACIFIVITN